MGWDVHNRLRSVTVTGGADATYTYDPFGRRITKAVTESGSTDQTVFLYDGWNLNLEETKNQAPETKNIIKRHTWGADLSGTLQGAGGVGGLLLTETITPGNLPVPMYATYDGNGNLTALTDASGAAVAGYEYDPYGNLIAANGPVAADNPFRFSTKYSGDESGLVYYGYRYYDAVAGRWVSRNPIEEEGGTNLLAFVGNDAITRWDKNGLCPGSCPKIGATKSDRVPQPCIGKDSVGVFVGLMDCDSTCICLCDIKHKRLTFGWWVTFKIDFSSCGPCRK